MRMRFIVILVSGILFRTLSAQEISMDNFLTLVKENHPFFQRESLTTEIEIKKQEGLLGAQDWVVTSSPYFSYQEMVSSNSFSPERLTVLGGGVGLERAIWSTGGRFSMNVTTDFTDQNVSDIVIPFPTGDFVIQADESRFYSHKIALFYSQPLLQNYKGKLDKLDYELREYAIDFSKVEVRENTEDFILDLSVQFVDWYFIAEQRRIVTERLKLARELLQQVKRRRAAYLVDRIDVLRAEDAVRIAQQNIVLIEAQYKARQAELAVLSCTRELNEMNPVFDLYVIDSFPEIEEVVDSLGKKSSVLKMMNITRKQLSYLLVGYEEMTRPQLFLNVGAGLAGGDSEFNNSLDITKPELTVSLSYRFPVGNRSAKVEVSEKKLALRQLDKDIESISLELEAAVRSVLIQILEMEKVLSLNKEQIESAKKKTKEETYLYNQGRGDLTFVIQSRDNEQNAELTYAQNAALYRTLVLQYESLVDELYHSVFNE
jgi:outer membrane protein TolC